MLCTMRIVLTLLSVMLFVALVTDFSPNSPFSPFPSVPSVATTSAPDSTQEEREEPAEADPTPTGPEIVTSEEPAQAPRPEPQTPSPETAALIEAEVVRLSNIERDKTGLNSLSTDTTLAATARAHSEDMLDRDFFDHNNPDGCSSSCRATAAGYRWRMVGENIYMMSGWDLTPTEAAIMIVNGWMSSTGHRENLLKDGYTETGVGVIVRGEAVYATAMYAKPR